MSNTNHRSRGHVVGLLAAAISLLIAFLLVMNRQQVVDQLSVWQYEPTPEIQTFADRSGMSENGEFYFFASQPSLESTQAFNQLCDRQEASAAILGCYNGQRIYIYNVTDERLDGIRSVTAAHEMLHAAYDRLGESERNRINVLLEMEYEKLKGDEDLAERMQFYARTEPGQRANELHSVIGAEVANISPELEEHYARYFADRSKVIALHNSYSAVFDRLQNRADELSAQLDRIGDEIEAGTVQYNQDVQRLNEDIADFNRRANGGGFSSQAEFNNERAALMARADQLETFRASINNNIERYETLRAELATIATRSEQLNRSINSSLAPAPSL